MELDDVVPDPDHAITQSRLVRARPLAVWHALRGVTMSALPLGTSLTWLRHLPDRLVGQPQQPLAPRTFIEETPIPLLFTDRPRSALSAGLSQAWRPLGGDTPPLLDARELRAWSEPGWIKVAMQFRLEPRGEATLLTCETRMVAVDARTRRVFGLYWFLIRAGSVAIRREVLSVVARHAESLPPPGAERR